jgi:hypothetical protein
VEEACIVLFWAAFYEATHRLIHRYCGLSKSPS